MNEGRTCDEATHSLIVTELLARHLPRIRAMAYKLARDAGPVSREEFAEEIVFRFKVSLLEGLLRRRGETDSTRGAAYLTRVVNTLAINYYRELEGRKKNGQPAPVWRFEGFIARVFEAEAATALNPRWVHLPLDKLKDADQAKRRDIDQAQRQDTDPATKLSRAEQAQVIRAVVREGHRQLGGHYIDIVLRRVVDDMTYDEVAAYLDVHVPAGRPHSPVTVRKHSDRARAVLRVLLQKRGFGPREDVDERS